MTDGLRLDKWLWHARFVRRRELASDLIAERRVRINGQLVSKTHHTVRLGDVLTLTDHGQVRIVRVKDLGLRRGTATDASLLYELVAAEH